MVGSGDGGDVTKKCEKFRRDSTSPLRAPYESVISHNDSDSVLPSHLVGWEKWSNVCYMCVCVGLYYTLLCHLSGALIALQLFLVFLQIYDHRILLLFFCVHGGQFNNVVTDSPPSLLK